jgi:hypothetical protein
MLTTDRCFFLPAEGEFEVGCVDIMVHDRATWVTYVQS